MARIQLSDNGISPLQRLLGHNVHLLTSWNTLEKTFESESVLENELKKQVQQMLSLYRGHEACSAAAFSCDRTNRRIALAVDFARIITDNHTIRDDVFAVMKSEFSEAEIVELCAFIFFVNTAQKLEWLFQVQE